MNQTQHHRPTVPTSHCLTVSPSSLRPSHRPTVLRPPSTVHRPPSTVQFMPAFPSPPFLIKFLSRKSFWSLGGSAVAGARMYNLLTLTFESPPFRFRIAGYGRREAILNGG